jgi:tetratricopeptide (TPR) repeat protein
MPAGAHSSREIHLRLKAINSPARLAKSIILATGFAAFFLLLGERPAFAQRTALAPDAAASPLNPAYLPSSARPSLGSRFASMLITVTDQAGAPLPDQALVKLYCDASRHQLWENTRNKSQVKFDSVPPCDYEVQASAAGYDTATESVDVMAGGQIRVVSIRLKRSGDIKPGQLLGPAAFKHMQKGLSALSAGRLDVAQKQFESAERLAPANADVNFVLGFLFVQKQELAEAETYFLKAVSFDPENVHAWTLLGQLHEQRGDFAGAVPPLEKAVSVDEHHWIAHWALALAYFHLQHFRHARAEAATTVREGNGAANAALVIGELAVAHLGKADEAVAAFKSFLRDHPQDQAAPAVRIALAMLQATPPESAASDRNLPLRALSSQASAPVRPNF